MSAELARLAAADDDRQLIVVQHWITELRERTAGKH